MNITETVMQIDEAVLLAIRFMNNISHRIIILRGLNTASETLCLTQSPKLLFHTKMHLYLTPGFLQTDFTMGKTKMDLYLTPVFPPTDFTKGKKRWSETPYASRGLTGIRAWVRNHTRCLSGV